MIWIDFALTLSTILDLFINAIHTLVQMSLNFRLTRTAVLANLALAHINNGSAKEAKSALKEAAALDLQGANNAVLLVVF